MHFKAEIEKATDSSTFASGRGHAHAAHAQALYCRVEIARDVSSTHQRHVLQTPAFKLGMSTLR